MPSRQWTPDEARRYSKLGGAACAAKRQRRKLESAALEERLKHPLATLPGQLSQLSGSISAEVERCKRESKPEKAEAWLKVLRRLVELQNYVETATRKNTQSNGHSSSTSPAMVTPRLVSPAENSSSNPDQVAGQSSSTSPATGTSHDQVDELEPIEHAPLD